MNNKKILTYGSLRKGEYNYEAFLRYYPNGLEYKRTTTVKGFDLYDLGSYPGIKESKDAEKELVVDIMHCSEECFRTIHGMELGAGYEAVIISIDNEDHTIYVYRGYTNKLVESGDWSKYLSHEQYTEA